MMSLTDAGSDDGFVVGAAPVPEGMTADGVTVFSLSACEVAGFGWEFEAPTGVLTGRAIWLPSFLSAGASSGIAGVCLRRGAFRAAQGVSPREGLRVSRNRTN